MAAEDIVTEVAQNSTRNTIMFYTVIVLLISTIGAWITKAIQLLRRIDRKEEVLNKIALDIVKLKKDTWNSNRYIKEFPALTLFFNIRDSLKKKIRYGKDYEEWLEEREVIISDKIEELERKIKQIEQEEENLYSVKESRKIPDSLKKKVEEVIQRFAEKLQQNQDAIYSINRYIDDIHNIYAFTHQEETEKIKEKNGEVENNSKQ